MIKACDNYLQSWRDTQLHKEAFLLKVGDEVTFKIYTNKFFFLINHTTFLKNANFEFKASFFTAQPMGPRLVWRNYEWFYEGLELKADFNIPNHQTKFTKFPEVEGKKKLVKSTNTNQLCFILHFFFFFYLNFCQKKFHYLYIMCIMSESNISLNSSSCRN